MLICLLNTEFNHFDRSPDMHLPPKIAKLLVQAEQGNSVAQFNLGCAYTNGNGVVHDDLEAIRWYRKAAEQ
ncbi:TPA: tetratricopeptide repeat protein, partial [Aeromonas veronii]